MLLNLNSEILKNILESFCVILLVPGKDEAANSAPREAIEETMERINGSITTLNEDKGESLRQTTESLEKNHVRSVQVFEQAQRQTLDAFQKASETQTQTMDSVLQGTNRLNQAILVFMILIFLVLTGLLLTAAFPGLV